MLSGEDEEKYQYSMSTHYVFRIDLNMTAISLTYQLNMYLSLFFIYSTSS